MSILTIKLLLAINYAKRRQNMKSHSGKAMSYIGLFFVVFVWGCSPLITLELYKYYSPTFRLFFSELVLFIAYMIICGKDIKRFNFDYIKIGVPTGIFLALANMTQKIGLLYTTPAKYAFLENLSCISVPVLMYILVRKKPTFMTVLSCITCLASVFVLNGISFNDASSWGIGEVLCAAAGLLYGFNIAGTGAYAKNFCTPLYLAVQSGVSTIIYLISSFAFSKILITGDTGIAAPMEKIVFSMNPVHIAAVVLTALIVSAMCWTIRTNAMKHIDASIVAIIMPFSAVITSVISILLGEDILSTKLVVGGILGLFAIFMSSYNDIFRRKLGEKHH